ncbi:hypothetical protein GH714_029853 [Hevea brasiliensis]|uniref:SBP-type domain-containing protein n=2 Tax=Hevea brasiliensis TaxID=3981 RepID=A0A6A6KVD2_HEVBR|nr:hypothetical protein GH714_029853 [Hevea brasiliensis]
MGLFGRYSVLEAMLWAILHGPRLAWELGIYRLYLECDNQLAGRILRKQCEISHIYREANSCADLLADLASSLPLEIVIHEDPPAAFIPLLSTHVKGILGSVLAKEGRLSNVSDLVSGAFKIAFKQVRRDDSTSSIGKQHNDSLMAQSSAGAANVSIKQTVTIVTASGTGLGASRYGVIVVVGVVGYGYIWWKGWKLPDMMFATRRSLSDACTSIAQQLENVYASIRSTRRQLSSNIDRVDSNLNEVAVLTANTQQKVTELLEDSGRIGHDVQYVRDAVETLELKISRIEGKQDMTNLGVKKLVDYAYNLENNLLEENTQACTQPFASSSSSRITFSSKLVFVLSQKGSLPPPSSELTSPSVSSGSLEIVEALCSSYLGPDYSQPKEFADLSIKDIDLVAKSSFPLCKSHLFEKLREDHHLKHGGRMQLGLFLKGVGLKLDDALAFWKAEFSQKVGAERFDKEYAYSIRHNYGREGERSKILNLSALVSYLDIEYIGHCHSRLHTMFSIRIINLILVKDHLFNSWCWRSSWLSLSAFQACTLTFEAIHGLSCDAGINHPNQYFSESQKVLKVKMYDIFGSFSLDGHESKAHVMSPFSLKGGSLGEEFCLKGQKERKLLTRQVCSMGYNLKTSWRLAELDNQNIPHIAQTTVSSCLGVQQATGHCSVDLKLGNSSDLEDKLEKFAGPEDSLMESSSSGSSKRVRTPSGANQVPTCLVDGCTSDLSKCRDYHRRHKVCELHSKTPKVFIKGQEQRFCQQCSRFHSLVEFDEGKRSCRKRLDGHNRRRRKPQPDSLSVNSARLLSNRQGTRYLRFGGSQMFSTSPESTAWNGAVKPENDPMLYTSQSSLDFSSGKNLFPGSLSHGYRSGKQFPFLQCTSSALLGESVCQSIFNADSTLGSTCSSQKMFSDGPNRFLDSNRALSLLSSPSAETREIGLSHMAQPNLNPQAQSPISNLNFSCLGMESGPVNSVLVSDGGSNANLHGQDVFQIGPEGSSTSGSLQPLSFSWE